MPENLTAEPPQPSMQVFYALVAALFLLLAGCAATPGSPTVESPTPLPPLSSPETSADGVEYHIVQAESELRLLVMKGGLLSRFGHNHVIGGPVISGSIVMAPGITDSSFGFDVDLTSLQVDKQEWRQQEGDAFSSTPSDDDIAGTRENMLGEMVLDVAKYPKASIQSAAVLGQLPEFSVLARITLKEHTKSIPVSVKLSVSDKELHARGEFSLTQSDFGIEPFSILLGAISVQDDIRVRFNIVARQSD